MVLTEKEMATIEDLHTQELSCVEKYKRYGQEAKDPVLRDLFADLEKNGAKACGVSGTGHERQCPVLQRQ